MPLRSICIDFNSYFASVEQQERPELRGLPVAVAPMLAETTCAIAASYPAKRWGVKTGTRIGDARRMCPGLVVVAARPDVYVEYHHRALAAIESCLPLGEVLSIDEVVCPLPPEFTARPAAEKLARKIKSAIRRHVGECMGASIGIAPNPLLAKLASDMQKPDGLVVLDTEDLPGRILHLSTRDFPGVGARMEERLRACGLTTTAELWAATPAVLRRAWGGVEGERFWKRLHGEDLSGEPTQRGSISHEHVLAPAERTESRALAVLQRLVQKAASRLRRIEHFTAGMYLSVRYENRDRWGTDLHFDETQDTLELLRHLRTLWASRPPGGRTPHKVGVVLQPLVAAPSHTPSLFAESGERRRGLNLAIDSLNQRLGKNTLYFAGAHAALRSAPTRIAFNHIPDAVETREAEQEASAPARPRPPPPPPPIVREPRIEYEPPEPSSSED